MLDWLFGTGAGQKRPCFPATLLATGLALFSVGLSAVGLSAAPTQAQPTATDSLGREVGAPPYPILFVHGLDGSDDTWKEMIGRLQSRWGESQVLDFNLNADGYESTCTISGDVSYEGSSLHDGNLYAMNFALSSTSNTAAIVKQGKALSESIERILEATGEEKVVLVGHSMGGLAIREYLQRRDVAGSPRWWVNPTQSSGHRVARVATLGTPHFGSNYSWDNLVFGSTATDSVSRKVGPFDLDSEAVRDLRKSYENDLPSGSQGRYIYGGPEGWQTVLINPWVNTDVNCNGETDDRVVGVSETDSDSFQMPLPKDISYTWVTSSCDGGTLGVLKDCNDVNPGDGVVELGSQYIVSEDGQPSRGLSSPDEFTPPYPALLADTLQMARYHTKETKATTTILRGLDEPDYRFLSYKIPSNQPRGSYIDAYFSAQPLGDFTLYDFTDFDVYRPEDVQTGSMTVTLPSPPLEFSSVFISENGITAGTEVSDGTGDPVQLTVSTAADEEHAIYAEGTIFTAERVKEYSIRADTRSLRHFSYRPRHGVFADTSDLGFASLRVPESVPQVGGEPLSEGDEIGVFTPEGTCVGAAVWAGAPTYISAFGSQQGGLEEGDSLRVRIWDRSAQAEYTADGQISGNGRYEPGRTLVAEELDAETAPPAPAGLAAEVEGGDIELSWNAPSSSVGSSGIAQYRIYRSTAPIGPAAEPSDLNALDSLQASTTSYTDEPEPGQTYYYRVTATGADQNESSFSEEAQAFLYPQEVAAQVSRSFGSASGRPEDYRLVALPGRADTSLAAVLGGEAGAKWQAFLHDSSREDPLVKYDGSEAFRFEAGQGFWITSTEELNFEASVPAVELREDSAATIGLQKGGWNLISNPLGKDVDWSEVEAATGTDLQPIWAFGGSFDSTATFASAREGGAYYFFNEAEGPDSLIVPYPGAPESGQQASGRVASNQESQQATTAERKGALVLSASAGSGPVSQVSVTLVESEAREESLIAPPGRFEPVSLRIRAQESSSEESSPEESSSKDISGRGGLLMTDGRLAEGGGATFPLRLTSRAEGPVELSAEGLREAGAQEARLLRPSEGRTYDLRKESAVTISPKEGEAVDLKLAVGTAGYVEQEAERVLPDELTLTSYPNPVRRQGTLEYALPEASEVSIKVYDVLGREVATLQRGQKQAGRHQVTLKTDRLSSGTYFGRLEAGGKTRTQKITVVR